MEFITCFTQILQIVDNIDMFSEFQLVHDSSALSNFQATVSSCWRRGTLLQPNETYLDIISDGVEFFDVTWRWWQNVRLWKLRTERIWSGLNPKNMSSLFSLFSIYFLYFYLFFSLSLSLSRSLILTWFWITALMCLISPNSKLRLSLLW